MAEKKDKKDKKEKKEKKVRPVLFPARARVDPIARDPRRPKKRSLTPIPRRPADTGEEGQEARR